MVSEDIKGKKLLLMGGLNTTVDMIPLAHRNGVKIGVVDYNKGTYVKSLADYVYDVSILDEEAVIDLYKREKYDGIITAFNERLGPIASSIAAKLGCPFPFTVEQLSLSTDKQHFKDMCIKHGVPVPTEYCISSLEHIHESKIKYPVIIKPVDSSSSIGVTPCFSDAELADGFVKAQNASRSKRVIVEEYLPYDEVNMTYIAQGGDIQLAAVHDRFFNTEQDSATKAPDLYIYPSRYTDLILNEYNATIINMLKAIGIRNGSLFIQAIIHKGQLFCYEAGIRLNGCKTYQILEYENDFNTMERLIRFALTGSLGEYVKFNPKMKKWYATLNVLGEPGATIAQYKGENELNTYPWLIHIAKRYVEGDVIPPDSAGTLVQDTTRIHLFADTKEELVARIDKVNELYRILDPNGRNIILKPHDTQEVLRSLNYEL